MRRVFEYPSYEEANDRQHLLIANGIPAKVERESTGFLEIYIGLLPIYYVIVDDENYKTAVDLLKLLPDPEHVHIAPCPKCGGGRVQEQPIDSGFGSSEIGMILTLFLPMVTRCFLNNLKGIKMRCDECGFRYRALSGKSAHKTTAVAPR